MQQDPPDTPSIPEGVDQDMVSGQLPTTHSAQSITSSRYSLALARVI